MDKAYWQRYEKRVRAYEEQGMTRSDAQGVVDAEEHTMPNTEKHTELRRAQALTFGRLAAQKQFNGRKGHGGNPVLAERHYSIEKVTVLLAAAWEAGAEYTADRAPSLLAQNERLRAALEDVLTVYIAARFVGAQRYDSSTDNDPLVIKARAALSEKE